MMKTSHLPSADEVVDVGDLGVVVVLGVAGLHLGDDALVLERLELLVHGDPAGLPPRVADRGVREAGLLRLVGGVLRGVGHLAVDVLQPRGLRVALERRRALLVLLVEDGLDEPLLARRGLLVAEAPASGLVVQGVVGAAGRQDGQRRCARERGFHGSVCASLVSCVRARCGRGGGSSWWLPGSGAAEAVPPAGRLRRGRRPTCQARAAAATATMMITPWTVSRQVELDPEEGQQGEEQLQREGAGRGREHPAPAAAEERRRRGRPR